MGYSAELADRILGHLRPSMERTYNKYAFLEERREALEAWERFALELVRKKPPKDRRQAWLAHLQEQHGAGFLEPADPTQWKEGTWEEPGPTRHDPNNPFIKPSLDIRTGKKA